MNSPLGLRIGRLGPILGVYLLPNVVPDGDTDVVGADLVDSDLVDVDVALIFVVAVFDQIAMILVPNFLNLCSDREALVYS